MSLFKVDETDRRILRHLLRDARQSMAALARRLGLSESAIRRRIDALIDNEIIKRFSVALDYGKVGYPITVLVGVNVGKMNQLDVAKKLQDIENIVDVYTVTGEFDLVLRIICKDIQCFEGIIEKVRNQPYIEKTRSFVVLNKIRDGYYDDIIELSQ
ncbi:MAG: Lrp/AsnC family transcriptional regulator [Candidatus Hodarchaeota archaeon]